MDTTPSSPVVRPRSPKTASRLSDLSYGLGQVYCGHLGRGLLIHAISMTMLVVWILLIVLMKGRFHQALLIGAVPAIAMWLFAKFDARRLAARAPADYALKEYNRWYVYAVFALLMLPVAVCGAFFIREAAYEAFQMSNDSMTPTLRAGDRILVNKTLYDVEPMRRGDVVVVRSPDDPRRKWVRRLIALPGDKVEVRGWDVIVNGTRLPARSVVPVTQPATGPESNAVALTVPHGHGFLLNDNLPANHDSRDVGPVPLGNVVGRVECIYWPRQRQVE